MGENDVAGGSPEGCLQKTALVGELVPSHQKKKIKTQCSKVDLHQSPKSRSCPMQEWELRPLGLLQPGCRAAQPARL